MTAYLALSQETGENIGYEGGKSRNKLAIVESSLRNISDVAECVFVSSHKIISRLFS